MISVLGLKRVLILAVVLILNAGLAAGVYLYFQPTVQDKEKTLRRVQGQISKTQKDLDQLQLELEKLAEQKSTFEELERTGFFNDQDRFFARDKIEEIQELSRVSSLLYNIEPARLETNDLIKRADHVVLSSSFSMEVNAIDDTDIYRLLYLIQTSFPGHVSIDSVKLSRDEKVTEGNLRRLANNEPVSFVKGTVNFTWRTVIPSDQIQEAVRR